MNDPLFDIGDCKQRERRISEATHRAEGIDHFDQATESLASRCLSFVGQRKFTDSEGAIASAFLSYLRGWQEAFPHTHDLRGGLRDGLNACLGGYDHELRSVSALLLGEAASAALVKGLIAGDASADAIVSRLFHLCAVDSLSYDALTAALARSLVADNLARKAMLGYLRECVDDINENPGKFVRNRDLETFEHYVREWPQNHSIVDLWRGSGELEFLPNFDHLNFVESVLRAAPAEVLRVLDQLRFPEPLNWIIGGESVPHNRDRMIKLIQLAPASFNHDGIWNGSMVALLVLRRAEGYCRDLWHTASQEDAKLERLEELLESWLSQVAAIVLDRNDGTFLATHWLLLKSMDERFARRSRDDDGFLPQMEMVGWIGGGLMEAGLRGRDISNAAALDVEHKAEDESPRRYDAAGTLDTLALIGMFDRLDDNTTCDSGTLLSRLDDLLVRRARDFEVEGTFDVGVTGFVDSSIGYLLAMENRTDRWKRSWDLLTEQRRVLQHWRHTKDSNALAPSLFLVRAGLAALDWLCSESFDRRGIAETLWQTMFDAVRECWLTISLTHVAQSIECSIGRLFFRHPMVFGASATKTGRSGRYSQRLADDLGALGGDDVLMARCCELVSRNLTDHDHLHHALLCNSGQGQTALRQFLRWQQLERPVKRQLYLQEAVERILAEVR